MSGKNPFTPEQAVAFLAEHDLGFLDLTELVLARAEKVKGSIKYEHPRVVVHIKQ